MPFHAHRDVAKAVIGVHQIGEPDVLIPHAADDAADELDAFLTRKEIDDAQGKQVVRRGSDVRVVNDIGRVRILERRILVVLGRRGRVAVDALRDGAASCAQRQEQARTQDENQKQGSLIGFHKLGDDGEIVERGEGDGPDRPMGRVAADMALGWYRHGGYGSRGMWSVAGRV